MKQRIRIIAVLLAIVSLLSTLPAAASSFEPRASLYLDDYFVPIAARGSSGIRVTFHVWGTEAMTKLGAKSIEFQISPNNSTWSTLATVHSNDPLYPDMLGENVAYHTSYIDFDGVPGVYYRAVVTVYAENKFGNDSRTVTTSSVYVSP